MRRRRDSCEVCIACANNEIRAAIQIEKKKLKNKKKGGRELLDFVIRQMESACLWMDGNLTSDDWIWIFGYLDIWMDLM
jgi:hypothetical protein